MCGSSQLVVEIGAALVRRGARVAVAESLTAGRLQALLAAISGASEFFDGGITAYHLDRKVELLGVPREAALACDGVSQFVAERMALGVCRLFRVAFGVATTGYAEASQAMDVAQPFAWIAVVGTIPGRGQAAAVPVVLESVRVAADGDRLAVQQEIAMAALAGLHRCLCG